MPRKPYRILLVDNDEKLLKLWGFLLEKQHFLVEKAKNGKQALKKAASWSPDIILLDVVMPGMSGVEVWQKLKDNSRTKSIPVIFCSGIPMKDLTVAGISPDNYLEKPFYLEELCQRIMKIIGNPRCF